MLGGRFGWLVVSMRVLFSKYEWSHKGAAKLLIVVGQEACRGIVQVETFCSEMSAKAGSFVGEQHAWPPRAWGEPLYDNLKCEIDMNEPEHVEKVERTAVKVRRTYRTWLASETALQRTIAKFIKVMKRARV